MTTMETVKYKSDRYYKELDKSIILSPLEYNAYTEIIKDYNNLILAISPYCISVFDVYMDDVNMYRVFFSHIPELTHMFDLGRLIGEYLQNQLIKK